MPNDVVDCFHCGQPVPATVDAVTPPLTVRVGEQDRPVCCPGCRAAVQFIGELGLDDFYRFRTEPSARPAPSSPDFSVYDAPDLLEALTRRHADGRSVVLAIDGMTCAACSWLINRSVEGIPGVRRISVNTATGRAQIVWDDSTCRLSQLLGVIAGLGYRPQLANGDATATDGRDERRKILRRLAVAGIGMMQVMMFAVAMYAGDLHGMDADVRAYLRIVSMLVATPVMLYGGWPYFAGAVQALSRRVMTMDVPVSLGLVLAYAASVVDTIRHSGEIYFDSVTMFIFFLTVARYVEMVARHQSTRVSDSLCRMLPATAHRLEPPDDAVAEVATATLRAGDHVLVRSGEVVPADGLLVTGCTRLDESMLSGESAPVERMAGDRVTGGTINLGSPVSMRITATGSTTVLSHIVALLTRAQTDRPRVTRAGDRFSSRFLARVLLGAAVVCLFWCIVDPARAFDATLAVLVAACPCAFSLATLVAVASATAALARQGVLVTSADAVEGLARVTRVVFDKTGTLTDGVVALARCTASGAKSEAECLQIAAALESRSEHPISRAFQGIAHGDLVVEDVRVVPGGGIEAVIGGRRYRMGTRQFAGRGAPRPDSSLADESAIVLASEDGDLATFSVADAPRPESASTIRALHALGLTTEVQSGDSRAAVEKLARHCGISSFAARRSPADKLARIQELGARGEFVAMVGDGINDAPVLGGAGVSIAMSRGSALTLASADLILIGDSLRALPGAIRHARRCTQVIRQNLIWAAGYNLAAMPLAAMGWIPPWAAAIGMSTSSIVVVLNSLRLIRPEASTAAGSGVSTPGVSTPGVSTPGVSTPGVVTPGANPAPMPSAVP